MPSTSKPWWQQAAALVSLSAGGAVTGLSFVPKMAADIISPASMPINLLALKQSVRPAATSDATLRSAIVNVANYYLRMAEDKSPAEMEAIIWQHDSIDGADHGVSCAAFASLTLELAAQVVGQQSWVSGGSSYPWPLHDWADVRVDPNPASLGITSILQDAQAHDRWHPLGGGYRPLAGDWVLFDGHVEVVTKYADGVLHTVGGDSPPNFSVNAHQYADPLAGQGVAGFVNNGTLAAQPKKAAATREHVPAGQREHSSGQREHSAGQREHSSGGHRPRDHETAGLADIPGSPVATPPRPPQAWASGGAAIPGTPVPPPRIGQDEQHTTPRPRRGHRAGRGPAAAGGAPESRTPRSVTEPDAVPGTAAIPGLQVPAHRGAAAGPALPAGPYQRHHPSHSPAPVRDTAAQQAFISAVAPGAVAAQRRYGVPAAVTIAQAIEESAWGQSSLAAKDNNLFGIKGTGPAGSDPQPTQEFENGSWVTRTAGFRAYHNVGESIDDHGRLLATSGYYTRAMAARHSPNAFANALTGVYATDPGYGAKLIGLMRQYNLYRYDMAGPAATAGAAAPGGATIPGLPRPAAATAQGSSSDRTPAQSTPAQATPAQKSTPSQSQPAASPRATPTATRDAARQHETARRMPQATPSAQIMAARRLPAPASGQPRKTDARSARPSTRRYQPCLPSSVSKAFITVAKVRLIRDEPLYRDVASYRDISWKLLAACDWMQCKARPGYSPVHGEKLGTVNVDGTVYRTRSEALQQCAEDLAELAWAVYHIDLTAREPLSIGDLANVFAAFRWGGLLKQHHTSAMEFPYSVAGLTPQHMKMRWPNIDDPNTPDKPGGRFRMHFGAVPIVLFLNYPATV